MSIITELRECIETANRSFEDARNPYNDREILHIPKEELTAIAKRIRKANNEAINKAHADGERNALKQNRSRSGDYRRGYAAGYAKGNEDGMDNIDGGTEIERIRSSITDELRKWWVRKFPIMDRELHDDFTAIADRIDAEHKKAVERARMDGMDETFGNGWVKLPVDADGEVIHLGDRLEHINGEFTVNDMTASIDGLWRAWDGKNGHTVLLAKCRHVKPDTWERIIGDALTIGWQNGNWNEVASAEVHDRLVERCRRLAGDAE